ncbi:MAG: hypothetical protein M3O03_03300 [Pseudomonadota bacterium]|nr:hypothetical protein [Pseudomonadota bacterium]
MVLIFTRFGTVTGHIIRIAAEAEEETDAKRQLTTVVPIFGLRYSMHRP